MQYGRSELLLLRKSVSIDWHCIDIVTLSSHVVWRPGSVLHHAATGWRLPRVPRCPHRPQHHTHRGHTLAWLAPSTLQPPDTVQCSGCSGSGSVLHRWCRCPESGVMLVLAASPRPGHTSREDHGATVGRSTPHSPHPHRRHHGDLSTPARSSRSRDPPLPRDP